MAGRAERPARPKRKPRSGPSANAARGEHSLTLAGKTYRLRPTFAATAAIEDELGQSALELLRRANGGALSYGELGAIVAEYVRAGAAEDDRMTKMVSAEGIAEKIYEEGVPPVLVVVTLVLADAVSGGRTASGEVKPVTEKSPQGTATGE